jgi:hypothetical protein
MNADNITESIRISQHFYGLKNFCKTLIEVIFDYNSSGWLKRQNYKLIFIADR